MVVVLDTSEIAASLPRFSVEAVESLTNWRPSYGSHGRIAAGRPLSFRSHSGGVLLARTRLSDGGGGGRGAHESSASGTRLPLGLKPLT